MRKPRLKRTLKRNTEFRPIENDDIRYLWACYKTGMFGIEEGMTPAVFKEYITEFMLNHYNDVYICSAETKDGFKPVGAIPVGGFYLGYIIGDSFWFPWATKRNIIESFVNFINEMRKDTYLMGFCDDEDKDFLVYMAKHGIIRRVGTMHPDDKTLKLFESRP